MKHEQNENAIRAVSRMARPQPPNTNKTSLDCPPTRNKNSSNEIPMRFTSSRQPTQNTTDIKPAAYSFSMTNKQFGSTIPPTGPVTAIVTN